MGNKQQTAVEWAFEQISNIDWKYLSDSDKNDLFNHALQMEREQIEYAYIVGIIRPLEMEASKQAKEYYNETYAD